MKVDGFAIDSAERSHILSAEKISRIRVRNIDWLRTVKSAIPGQPSIFNRAENIFSQLCRAKSLLKFPDLVFFAECITVCQFGIRHG